MSIVSRRAGSPYWYVTKTRQSTKTTNRKLAEEFARKVLQEVWRDEVLGDRVYRFGDIESTYLDVKSHKRSLKRDEFVLDDFKKFLLERKLIEEPLQAIDADTVSQYAKRVKARASARTANLHLQILGAAFKLAVKRKMIREIPDVERYEVLGEGHPRFLAPEEITAICNHLPYWVADMVRLNVQTGMRWGNVAGLRWDWLSPDGMVCFVPATSAKTKRIYTIPLSTGAREVIERRRVQLEIFTRTGNKSQSDFPYVFWNPERPGEYVSSMRFWWGRALKRAGVEYCKPHTLRHTWASWHVQNHTPDRILMTMGGWSSPAMLKTYAHLDMTHLQQYADNLNGKKPT